MSKIFISIKDFLQTGRFGEISLSDSPDKIKSVFGEPDGYGGTSRKYYVPRIWQYGDFEFFFNSTNDLTKRYLCEIHADHLCDKESISGGIRFDFDQWIIRGGSSQNEIENKLAENQISFELIDWKIPDETIRLRVGVGVELVFNVDGNRNFLNSFSYSLPENQKLISKLSPRE